MLSREEAKKIVEKELKLMESEETGDLIVLNDYTMSEVLILFFFTIQ